MAFTGDIADLTRRNSFFRREVFTNEHSQLVVMSIEAGEDIGEETHDVDQILVFVAGEGEAVLNGERTPVTANTLVSVPAGTRHNFINTGSAAMKLYTFYSPPEEPPGTIHRTKAEAEAAESH
jgi:mannose-6-phosphate isomerase-like protein (cupin superfamily)